MTDLENICVCFFEYGKVVIQYELHLVDRKTIEISVFPDKLVIVKAPVLADKEIIDKKIKKKARWISKQLDYFDQFIPFFKEKFYVQGESHLYLGKNHRLKIINGSKNSVKLKRGVFLVETLNEANPENIKKILNLWYLKKAEQKFIERFEYCWNNFKSYEINKPIIKIRKMKKRWGSFSENGIITFNIELIKVPKECIDYVIYHELCHIRYKKHNKDFYNILSSYMPEWLQTKNKLELMLFK